MLAESLACIVPQHENSKMEIFNSLENNAAHCTFLCVRELEGDKCSFYSAQIKFFSPLLLALFFVYRT